MAVDSEYFASVRLAAVPTLLRQFARFVVVGVGNTVVSWVSFAALVTVLPTAASAALAFLAGAANGYVWNGRWTFAGHGSRRPLVRYALVQAGGLGATTGLVWLLDVAGIERFVAYGLATVLVTCSTFAANRWWTFRPSV
jgi:putative flippase GtrA